MLAIISSSHCIKLSHFLVIRRKVVCTPYGEPSCALAFCTTKRSKMETTAPLSTTSQITKHSPDKTEYAQQHIPIGFQDTGKVSHSLSQAVQPALIFLASHGYSYFIPPHEINYRANIWALSQQKVKGILAITSVAGIHADFTPGTLVMPNQIIDYTWGRGHTFFDTDNHQGRQIDFTEPYSHSLHKQVLMAAQDAGEKVLNGGVYACTQGPRLESAAEVRRIEKDGGDMIGMTGMPEAGLARELNIPYITLAIVSNRAAGKTNTENREPSRLTEDDYENIARKIQNILSYLPDINV